MALGTQSVLGISSNLTWDVIEQMKDLDVSNQIDPITEKLEKKYGATNRAYLFTNHDDFFEYKF